MLGAQEKRACIAAGPFSMADSGGFEPPTARFVAEYSIQLSYESVERAHYKESIFIIKH